MDAENAAWYLRVLGGYPQNKWVPPYSGSGSPGYEVFATLHEWGLAQQMRIPIWQDGRLARVQVWFRWNEDLSFFAPETLEK